MGATVSQQDVDRANGTSSTAHGEALPVQYNVYGQPINPLNQMPATPAQVPWEGQRVPLPTSRVQSNIPKGGTNEETWNYPSPQMFFNAMRRKGKGDGVREEDIGVAVAVHNNTNERAWKQVLQWENQRVDLDAPPKLLKFNGTQKLSPKAWIRHYVLGKEKPFDRHDWIVQRGSTQLRYIIDFYSDDLKNSQDALPGLNDHTTVKSILIDVRPAVESWTAIKLRLFNMFSTTGEYLPEVSEQDTNVQIGREITAKSLQISSQDSRVYLTSQCSQPLSLLAECVEKYGRGSDQCAKPLLGVHFCLGNKICPSVSLKFLSSLQNSSEEADKVLDELTQCISESPIAQSLLEKSN